MRIQGIALENHRHLPFSGTQLVGQLPFNQEFALADILKACDHAQGCGFSAAGGADKHDKFPTLGFQIKIMYSMKAVGVDLVDIPECEVCHGDTLLCLDLMCDFEDRQNVGYLLKLLLLICFQSDEEVI